MQRYPWLAYLVLAVACLAVAGSAYYVDTAYMNGYNAGYNDSWHIAYDKGIEDGRNAGYDLGFEQGTQQGLKQGRNATLDALEQGEPTVLFRIDAGNNRSIAYAYPAANFSYTCGLSKTQEWQVGDFTYLYNGTTECELRHTDLTQEWNEAGFDDVNLARQARQDYQEHQNRTNSTG